MASCLALPNPQGLQAFLPQIISGGITTVCMTDGQLVVGILLLRPLVRWKSGKKVTSEFKPLVGFRTDRRLIPTD